MPRVARVVIAGVPHHVTQRGNRRPQTFFSDADYRHYRALLAEHCRVAGVECWGYCLMPNHVHLILVPAEESGLRLALAETHRRYTRSVNAQHGWTGFLWAGPVRVRADGRGAHAGVVPVRGAEPRQGAPGGPR